MAIPKDKLAILIGKVKDKGHDKEDGDREGKYDVRDCAGRMFDAIKADDKKGFEDAVDRLVDEMRMMDEEQDEEVEDDEEE